MRSGNVDGASGVHTIMRRGIGLAVMLAACTPTNPASQQQAPRFPPHSAPAVPSGPLGQPGDEIARLGDKGQWLVVCRGQPGSRVPRLILDEHNERSLDQVEASDASGMFVLFTDAGHRRLYDLRTREAFDLGTIADTTRGDIRDGRLAYGRRAEGSTQIVLRTLATGEERVLPSPMPGLHAVQIERSGRGLWLTGSEIVTERHRKAIESEDEHYARTHMCEASGPCEGYYDLPRRYKGLMWGLNPADTPSFIELDDNPSHPRALAGAVVHSTSKGVELIHADRREPIDAPECYPVRAHHHDDFLLLRCGADDPRRYLRWTPTEQTTLDFWGPGIHTAATDSLLPGAWNRWLVADSLQILHGGEHQSWGYAYGDHVVLVGSGVELRDARTDTRVARIPGTFAGHRVDGPYVALRNPDPDRPGGRVIDIRDGHTVSSHSVQALHLAATGQVLVRDDDGRLRWMP